MPESNDTSVRENPSPRRRLHRVLLFGILVFSFAIRVVHNSYLLPPVGSYPNEVAKRDAALKLTEENFDHGSSMPSLLLNSLYVLYFPVRWVHAFGHARWPGLTPFSLDLPAFYLWFGRVYMALFGTAAIWVVYLLGKRLGSRSIGLAAAGLLAVAPIHVLGSRHMKEDMPLALFTTAALVFMVDLVRRGSARDYRRAALFSGICFSTKWIGVIAFPFLYLAHRFARYAGATTTVLPRRKLFALVFGFIALGFVLGSPDYLLKPYTLYKGLRRAVKKSYTEHSDGMHVDRYDLALTDYYRTGLWPGMTPPLAFLALGGFFWLRRSRSREAILLGLFFAVYYLLLETARARPYPHYQRYLQPIVPCFAVFAACGLQGLAKGLNSLCGRWKKNQAGVWLAALTAAAVVWPIHDSFLYLRNIPKSTVIQCYEYLSAHVPSGSLVLSDGYACDLDRKRYRFLDYREKSKLLIDDFPSEPCYVLFSADGLGRFLKQPEANPQITRFVYYVLANGELLAEWRPAFRSFYCESPAIALYRFDKVERKFKQTPQDQRGGDGAEDGEAG